jgi:hypothetical protein
MLLARATRGFAQAFRTLGSRPTGELAAHLQV